MTSSFIATLATIVVFEILMLLGVFFQVVNAFWVRRWRGFVLHLLAGVLYLIAGVFLIEHPAEAEQGRPIRLAVVGRPNVGKSTLINRLIGEERMLTGPEAGITRDAIAVDFDWHGRAFRLYDTAGLRRRSRVEEKLAKAAPTCWSLRVMEKPGLVPRASAHTRASSSITRPARCCSCGRVNRRSGHTGPTAVIVHRAPFDALPAERWSGLR